MRFFTGTKIAQLSAHRSQRLTYISSGEKVIGRRLRLTVRLYEQRRHSSVQRQPQTPKPLLAMARGERARLEQCGERTIPKHLGP